MGDRPAVAPLFPYIPRSGRVTLRGSRFDRMGRSDEPVETLWRNVRGIIDGNFAARRIRYEGRLDAGAEERRVDDGAHHGNCGGGARAGVSACSDTAPSLESKPIIRNRID